MVYVTVSPSFGVGLLVCLMTSRSAYFGVSVAVALLLPGVGSGSTTAVISAVFVCGDGMVPAAGIRTVAGRSSVTLAFGCSVPIVQIPVPGSYDPCDGAMPAVSSNNPDVGKVSVSSIPVATLGPAFVTVTVNVMVSPTLGVGSLTVFETRKSAVFTVNVAASLVL